MYNKPNLLTSRHKITLGWLVMPLKSISQSTNQFTQSILLSD